MAEGCLSLIQNIHAGFSANAMKGSLVHVFQIYVHTNLILENSTRI